MAQLENLDAEEILDMLDRDIIFPPSCGAPPQRPRVSIHQDHVFRHAKELVTATHGRYLEGFIELPLARGSVTVVVSTMPAGESQQSFQPNLLHVTMMDDNTRKASWKSTLTSGDWRIRLNILDGQAFLVTDEGMKMVNCIRDNKIILGGDDGLLLTIITPLQTSRRGDPSGVRIEDVVEDRLRCIGGGCSAPEMRTRVKEITENFTDKRKNKTAKIELHRCRILVDFLDDFGAAICESALSADICNTKHTDVGALELHDMSDPRSSCGMGGFKVLLSSEFKAPTLGKVRAVFVIAENGKCIPVEQRVRDFNQISLHNDKFQIHQNTIAFIVPPQSPEVISQILRNRLNVQVALYRPHDDKYSKTTFPFYYVQHDDDCHFCAIREFNRGSLGLRQYDHARRRKRRRITAEDSYGDLCLLAAADGDPAHSPDSSTSGIPSSPPESVDEEATDSNNKMTPMQSDPDHLLSTIPDSDYPSFQDAHCNTPFVPFAPTLDLAYALNAPNSPDACFSTLNFEDFLGPPSAAMSSLPSCEGSAVRAKNFFERCDAIDGSPEQPTRGFPKLDLSVNFDDLLGQFGDIALEDKAQSKAEEDFSTEPKIQSVATESTKKDAVDFDFILFVMAAAGLAVAVLDAVF